MSKTYSLSFDETDVIITVKVSGTPTHEDHCVVRDEALQLCRDKHCSKLLVDLRELNTQQSSTMNCYAFGESLARLFPGICIAHVLPVSIKSKKDIKFTSTVEANRGAITGDFEDIVKAREWLLEKHGLFKNSQNE